MLSRMPLQLTVLLLLNIMTDDDTRHVRIPEHDNQVLHDNINARAGTPLPSLEALSTGIIQTIQMTLLAETT